MRLWHKQTVSNSCSCPQHYFVKFAAALQARLAAVVRLRAGLAEPSSVISQSVAAYQDLLDGGVPDGVVKSCIILQAVCKDGVSSHAQLEGERLGGVTLLNLTAPLVF